MAVPFNLPPADEEDYQLIHELLMTVQRAVYQIIFRRSYRVPQQQPPNPAPRILRGCCPRCGRSGGQDNGGIPAPAPGSVGPVPDEPAPGAAGRLPDVVPRGDAAPAGEPTPPARRGRPQPPARRARRRRPPPPPVPPPRGVRPASASGQKKYWELAGENLRHIADEFRPSPPKETLGQPEPRFKDTSVLALLLPRTVWAALILMAGWKLARKVR